MLWGSYRWPVVKVMVIFILFLLSLMVGITSALQFPAVQTVVTQKLADYFSNKIGLSVEIGKVNINWFTTAELADVIIRDRSDEVLIAAKNTRINYNVNSLFSKKSITFNKAVADSATVRIINNMPDGRFNINHFVDGINRLVGTELPDSLKKVFNIREIELTNSTFLLSDPEKDSIAGQFNHNQFKLQNIHARAEDLRLRGKNFQIQISELSCLDSATQFEIHNLSGFYQITKNSMVFRTFKIDAGKSHLEASMVFQFDSLPKIKEFVDSVNIIADIKESNIYSRDLGNFAQNFKKYSQFYKFDGFFNGTINRFEVDNFELAFGSISRIRGSVLMDGLPDIANTFIDLNIQNSILNPADLDPYMEDNVIDNLNKFGRSSFNGRFIGFPVDFVSDAVFYTQIGTIDSDINLKIDPDNDHPKYSGSLTVNDFDLGKFLNNEDLFQNIDLQGKIEGEGVYVENANFHLDATIDNFGFLGYNYRNIVTDGRFSSQIFNGYLSINDPNLIFELNGNVDLTEEKEKIEVIAVLDTAILNNLNITEKPASISTLINVNLAGLDLNKTTGQIHSSKTNLFFDGRTAEINNLKLISEKLEDKNYLELSSDNIDLHITGEYNLTDVIGDVNQVIKEYRLIARNNRDTLRKYWTHRKNLNLPDYNLEYNLTFFNINPFLNLFVPELYVAEDTRISGHISANHFSNISLNTKIDTLVFDTYSFINNTLKVSAVKSRDSAEVDLSLDLSSESQYGEKGGRSNNLYVRGKWEDDMIDLDMNIRQEEKQNIIHIQPVVEFDSAFTRINFRESDLVVLGNSWKFNPDNRILIRSKNLLFADFHISSGDQLIDLSGYISEDTSRIFVAKIENFEIENVNSILPREFMGILDGRIAIERFYDTPVINSEVEIDDLVFENFEVGDFFGSSHWDLTNNKLIIDIEMLNNEKKKIIDIEGNYAPYNETDKLDLLASFDEANINVIEPFYEDLISDLTGNARGEFSITGTLRKPVLKGEGYVSKGGITIDYLKTNYNFEGNIAFTEDEIGVIGLILRDKFNNTGIMNGGIIHDHFKNIRFDIRSEFENLLTLNTSAGDNDLFYGTAYGTGTLHIYGQEKVINMDINATTEPGTRFYIPLSGSSEASQENFIQFIDLDSTGQITEFEAEEVLKLKGIRLNFDLEITPDAYAEIIFDQTAGDIIRGRGNGQLSMTIDTQGEFNMFGDFVFESGGYNFTLYNVINKEFSIEPESRITWSGDPYGGIMDLTANYRQVTSLAPIFGNRIQVDSAFANKSEVKRKYPVIVELQLEGPLLSPEINFNIEIEDYENVVVDGISFETAVAAFKSNLQSNEQELKRQVFSLIILRRFAPEGSFAVGGTSFGNSVSEFISNQLSYWITQIDENLEIDLDLGTLDQNSTNTFQYRMAYTFNEGRLRISRSGNITDEEKPDNISNIIGDWTLEYLLTEDGELRAKMYNRFDYNNLVSPAQRNTTATAGFSFMYTKSFNNIKELFKGKEKKKSKSEEEDYIEFDEGLLPSREKQENQEETTPDASPADTLPGAIDQSTGSTQVPGFQPDAIEEPPKERFPDDP